MWNWNEKKAWFLCHAIIFTFVDTDETLWKVLCFKQNYMHDVTWYWSRIRKESCYSKSVILYESNVVLNRTQLLRSSFCLISLKRIRLIKDPNGVRKKIICSVKHAKCRRRKLDISKDIMFLLR